MFNSYATPGTVAHQASLFIGFSGQDSELPFPSGDLPDPGIEPESWVLADEFFTTEPPDKSKILNLNISFIIL